MDRQAIYLVGTADTKGAELAFLAGRIADMGGKALIVDVGTRPPTIAVDIPAADVAGLALGGAESILGSTDRGRAVAAMGEAFARFITGRGDIAGVLGIGGGGGTSIITRGLRELPLGLPKLMVSTMASGNTAPFVGVSDIVMMPAITDLAGLNRISREVLTRAAGAILGMAAAVPPQAEDKPALGLTMFGVTTPAVTAVTAALRDRYDCLVFHATGTGGRSMEKLADSGRLAGVIDLTTTEIADLLFGGVLAATEDRMEAIIRTGLPYVGSVGALDMINFEAVETLPPAFRQRILYRHNPNVTLVRTTVEENRALGEWIAAKLNRMPGKVRFLIPERGVSALDVAGGAFFVPQADQALFQSIAEGVRWTPDRQLIRLPLHINDPDFARAAVAAWDQIAP